MSQILIGTTSWTDKTLLDSGLFYPPAVKSPEQRLRFYASQFPIVEVDSSYYALPSERNSILWVKRTPDEFTFDIKAFRLFTQHQTPLTALPAEIREGHAQPSRKNIYSRDLPPEAIDELWQRFHSALEPLRRSGKLGVVLFQFPPWFVYRPSNLDYIAGCAERLEGYQLAIEFRNKSWLGERHCEEVLAFERANGLAHVIADEPQGFASSIPAVWQVTSPKVAVIRLHGRNRATWEKPGLTAAERFNYLYSAAEIQEFLDPIQRVAANAKRVHVLFNNCYSNHAQRNATELQRVMDLA